MKLFPRTEAEREKDILWFFDLALLAKAANGALEMLGAVLVLVVPPSFILGIVTFLTGGELDQDAGDPVANGLVTAAQAFTIHTHYLLAIYLALHGAIKVLLVIGIFMGKKIAYPLFMLALIIFGGYEAYRGFVKHETLLQVIAILDLTLLILTVYEFKRRYPTHSFLHGTLADYVGR